MNTPYEVVVAPGCHDRPIAPVISRHRTLRGAVRSARRSDRLQVEPATSSVCLYRAKSRQPTQHGYGAYGGPDTRPLAVCYAEAEAAEAAWRNEQ